MKLAGVKALQLASLFLGHLYHQLDAIHIDTPHFVGCYDVVIYAMMTFLQIFLFKHFSNYVKPYIILELSHQETSESGAPKAKAFRMKESSHSKGNEPLYPPPPPLLVDPLMGLSDQAKAMTEEDDILLTMVLDLLRTLGLSNDIPKPSVTTYMNLVKELDVTLEMDEELGEPSFI
ncbi:hypothetical protein F0562_025450 [Nyssa sinensis]|uniref:Uncharacterized protein n=1 Tax=Nyssa sinensis TaxID=561372 RepID=A0A5J5BI61_9ASTE|nr:hypothetical protein F0562_025450 [Nyssa sinensis]